MPYLIQWYAVVLLAVICSVFSQGVNEKESPCKKVFRYLKDSDNVAFGKVTVTREYLRNANNIQLNVGFLHEFPLTPNYKASIVVQQDYDQNDSTKPLIYKVIFPNPKDYFYVTSVELNGQQLCPRSTVLKESKFSINLSHQMLIKRTNPVAFSQQPSTPPAKPTVQTPKPQRQVIQKPNRKNNTERPHPDNFVKPLKRDSNIFYNSNLNKTYINTVCGKAKSKPRMWPWIIAVYQKGLTKLTMVSSGALISDIFIVTAAQPVSKFNNRATIPEELSVRVGAFDLDDWIDEDSNPRTVRQIIYHPDFNRDRLKLQDNIALLRIKPLKFNQFMSPICLIQATRNIKGTENGITIGWGQDLEDKLNIKPSEIKMKILPIDTCKSSNKYVSKYITPNTLCVEETENNSDLCSEEQGKGLYLEKKISNKWILAGILTYSIKLSDGCRIEKIRIFTDLTKYVNWIEEKMWQNSYD